MKVHARNACINENTRKKKRDHEPSSSQKYTHSDKLKAFDSVKKYWKNKAHVLLSSHFKTRYNYASAFNIYYMLLLNKIVLFISIKAF